VIPFNADAVYDVLVAYAGASEQYRDDFRFYMDEPLDRYEWRFQGALGFGGKLYRDARGLRVGCYREDETSERCAMVAATNEALAALSSSSVE